MAAEVTFAAKINNEGLVPLDMSILVFLEINDAPLAYGVTIWGVTALFIKTILDLLSPDIEVAGADALADDFNTAMVVANLFDMLKKINSFTAKPAELLNISGAVLEAFLDNFRLFVVDILGILPELDLPGHLLLDSLIRIYTQAKAAKDYAQIDALRADLKVAGIAIKDTKFGISWAYIE